jgi:hypothetical protein
MNRLAIDIIILPPEPILDKVIAWNQALCRQRPENIVQNKVDTLPHVSLAMGCLRADLLTQAREVLHTLAQRHSALHLEVPCLKLVSTASGDSIVTLDIKQTPALKWLHQDLVDSFQSLLTSDATEKDLFDSPPIEQSSVEWINQYIPKQSFEHFWPHITAGFGSPPDDFQPFSFRGERLAMCHLGNYCTCRKILHEVRLI